MNRVSLRLALPAPFLNFSSPDDGVRAVRPDDGPALAALMLAA